MTAFLCSDVVKLTVEGRRMPYASGVVSRVFTCLSAAGVAAHLITTSETMLSLCIDAAQEQSAVAAVREAFGIRL